MADWYSVMSSVAVPLPEGEAAALLSRIYGVEGALLALPGERDQNFRVSASDGRRYVFKLHHPDEDPAVVDLQNAALGRVQERAPGLPTPRVQASLEGALAPRGPDGRVLRLLTWVDGEPLAERLPLSPGLRQSLGALLGALDAALSGLEDPGVLPPLMWDIQRVPELRHMLDDIPDPPVAGLARAAVDRLESEALPAVAGLARQVIHNDANPFNSLAEGDRVSGLLDFGDMVVAPRVQELAVAAAYYLEPDPVEATVVLARAYHRVYPLMRQELAHLPALVAARCAQTVMIGSWRRRQLPPHIQYVLKNYERAARGLSRLDAEAGRLNAALAGLLES